MPATSSRRSAWPQSRGSKFDAFPDGLWIDSGSILAAQMAPKSRPGGVPDTLFDAHQSQIEKKRIHASFALALSTLRRCNLTVKNQVFLKILTLSLSAFLLHILCHKDFKISLKIGLESDPKSFQNGVRNHMRLGNVS